MFAHTKNCCIVNRQINYSTFVIMQTKNELDYPDLSQKVKDILNAMIQFMPMDDKFDINIVFRKAVIECRLILQEEIPIADKLFGFLTKQKFIFNPGLPKLTENGKQLKKYGSFEKYYDKIK